MKRRPTILDDEHEDVVELSALLRRLADLRGVTGAANFRNPEGVAMKLGNLAAHDPTTPSRSGLSRGAQELEARVWREYDGDPVGFLQGVSALRDSIGGVSLHSAAPAAGLPSATPRIFVTGMWGFNPSNEGYVGFTNASVRDRYIEGYAPGDLMLIVGQRGERSEERDVGRALGLVDLDPVPIHETERLSAEAYREKVALWGDLRWQHAMPISRAWKFESNIKAQFLAPVTCAPRFARVIGANFRRLTDAEVSNVLGSRMRPVRVWGADAWSESIIGDEPAELGRTAVSRGPVPSFGTRTVVIEDGPTAVYVMCLEGCVDALFPELTPEKLSNVVIKVGRSNEPDRRVDEMNGGFPPGARARWSLHRHQMFSSANQAHAAEQEFLRYLAGRDLALGREFACVPRRELETLLAMFVTKRAGVVIA